MKKIYCVGELLIDFICEDSDVSLRDATSFTRKAGGAPANVAVGTAYLGRESLFLGSVGQDAFGDFLVNTLEQYGVQTEFIKRDPHRSTTMAFVSLTERGSRSFVFNRGADESLCPGDFNPTALQDQILHLGSATALLGGALEETYAQLLAFAKQGDTFISFDPNFRPNLWEGREAEFIRACGPYIESADFIKMSDEEVCLLMQEPELEGAMQKLRERTDATHCITLGAEGAWVSTGREAEKIPAFEVKTVDTTGAGDAFVSGVLDRLAREAQPKEAVKEFEFMKKTVASANRVAALTTTEYGAIAALKALESLT